MISKNEIGFISALKEKKFRNRDNLFIVEGVKMTSELLESNYRIHSVFALKDWITKNQEGLTGISVREVSEIELKKISALSTPQEVLAVVEIPSLAFEKEIIGSDLTIVLDDVRDPGNMGTIIRVADWFGIKSIICSFESVDVYNPKVVQSTMGSIFRVGVYYQDLKTFFKSIEKEVEVFGALLEGANIYNEKLPAKGIVLMGNESRGISKELISYITNKITIPSFSSSRGAESLNVAIATAIICSEFKRSSIK